MTFDEFQEAGSELLRWIADYHRNVERHPVLSRARPGDVTAKLPGGPPQDGDDFASIIHDLDEIIIPGITHWQSPNFFAFFPSNVSGPSILADLVSSGLGVQGMMWVTSPACTELETRVLDWLVAMLGLPSFYLSTETGGGVIQDTASSATLTAVVAARERATGSQSNTGGVPTGLVAYASGQAHSSVEKAMRIAGVGSANLRTVRVDSSYALDAAHLRELVEADLAEGLRPFFVSATIGTTASLALDPVPAIGDLCREYHLWLHVDAAMAGSAAVCPEFRYLVAGLDKSDSFVFNPHKWLLTNFDCSCYFVRDRSSLTEAMTISPEYLRTRQSDEHAVIDYKDWHIPLGRRFRSLKLWFVIRYYGVEGLQSYIRHHVALAARFAEWVAADDRFAIAAPPRLNLVCFRLVEGNSASQKLLERLNAGGGLYLTHCVLDGLFTLRLCVGQTHTRMEHVESAWKTISAAADDLMPAPQPR